MEVHGLCLARGKVSIKRHLMSSSQKEEMANQKAYEDLKAAKEEEIAAGQAQIDTKTQDDVGNSCFYYNLIWHFISFCYSIILGSVNSLIISCAYRWNSSTDPNLVVFNTFVNGPFIRILDSIAFLCHGMWRGVAAPHLAQVTALSDMLIGQE